MPPEYCPKCGRPTKQLIAEPKFCGTCGQQLTDATPLVAKTPSAPAIPATHDPYPGLDGGDTWRVALDEMLDRHYANDAELPLNVGVIVLMPGPITSFMPMHQRNFDSQLADPAKRPLPYNLTVNPHIKDRAVIWIDANDRTVSRAGAIVYYWGSAMGKKWHFREPLNWEDSDRLVTTTAEQTIDFEIRLKPDMRDETEDGELNYTRVLTEAFSTLEQLLIEGVNTKNRHIEAVGRPVGWAIFAIAELDPKYRRQS